MTPYYRQDGITIYHGDCRDVMEDMTTHWGEKLFDLLLTDPPYGISADRDRNSQDFGWVDYGATGWDDVKANDGDITTARKLCKKAVIWGGNYFDLPSSMGWLVWDKGQREFSLADGELAWTSERRALRIVSYARAKAKHDGREHPTQKPMEVMTWCLTQFPTSQSIFDPFMGSGTTLVAAKRLGKQATGIEREERYCEIAARRLAQGSLFTGSGGSI